MRLARSHRAIELCQGTASAVPSSTADAGVLTPEGGLSDCRGIHKARAATARRCIAILIAALFAASTAAAQKTPPVATDVATALTGALSAACQEDPATFASFLPSDNSAAFLNLVGPQKIAFMKRMVQLDDPGHPLISTSDDGLTVLRCETPAITTEMRFGPTTVRDNVAFIAISVPSPGEDTRTIRFGLVREQGQWKLLSLGLVLLDVQALSDEWAHADAEARENDAVDNLRAIASALDAYRRAFGSLPDTLAQLGPAPATGISREAASLIDAELAAGQKGGYKFRYRIVPSAAADTPEDQNKLAQYEIAATPIAYGKTGKRSFFLDSSGALRGADLKGAVAGPEEPRIDAGSDAQTQP
jgi:type II secretory pathway pseudopilin PulG